MSPFASYAVQTLVSLICVIAVAVTLLYAARRVGVGRPSGPLELLGKLPLDGRRTVYLVRVGAVVFVIGGSEAGLAKFGELPREQLPETAPEPRFTSVLRRVLGKRREPPDAQG
jgi:flagellar biogenesis protein FliO